MAENAPNTVTLILTFAEAGALFETANLGMARKAELDMPINEHVSEALQKIARGMGFSPTVDGPVVQLLPPMEK